MQARARLIAAQQDRVVTSYTLLSAIGPAQPCPSGAQLAGLRPAEPITRQVWDVWHGLRSPSVEAHWLLDAPGPLPRQKCR
jgi:hypothetical protein